MLKKKNKKKQNKTKQNRKLISTKINNEAIWGWWKCLCVEYFLHDTIGCSEEGAAGFYELLVKRVAHLECSTCRLWVFADICIHGPPQDVYLDFSSWLGDSLCSSVCFSYLHFLFTHTFIFYVCVWPRRRERQFFQKLNILYLIYIHQGHFHFKFNILVILIFSKILANLQGFGSTSYIISESVQFSSVVSNSLWPHESQHARPPCPSLSPGVHSNSHPSSQWCHPAISSSVVPFSSCPQSLPASDSFPMSQLFTWGGQSTGVSALASFLPKNTQGWSPLEWCIG